MHLNQASFISAECYGLRGVRRYSSEFGPKFFGFLRNDTSCILEHLIFPGSHNHSFLFVKFLDLIKIYIIPKGRTQG